MKISERERESNKAKRMQIIIHTDGGAIGNPGPAGIGVVIEMDGKVKTYAEGIGNTTNNVAEYKAVLFALKKARLLAGKKIQEADIHLYLDSELVGNQMTGNYKIKDPDLQTLFVEYWNMHLDLPPITFHLVPREQNTHADKLVKSVIASNKLL